MLTHLTVTNENQAFALCLIHERGVFAFVQKRAPALEQQRGGGGVNIRPSREKQHIADGSCGATRSVLLSCCRSTRRFECGLSRLEAPWQIM